MWCGARINYPILNKLNFKAIRHLMFLNSILAILNKNIIMYHNKKKAKSRISSTPIRDTVKSCEMLYRAKSALYLYLVDFSNNSFRRACMARCMKNILLLLFYIDCSHEQIEIRPFFDGLLCYVSAI